MNILIIDDDEVDCISICRQISTVHNCEYANDEDSALDKIKNNNYECILLDYLLRNTTGLDLMSKIKELTDTPIIFVTGHGSEDIAVEALKNGAKDYVVKTQKNHIKLLSSIEKRLQEEKTHKEKINFLKNIQKDLIYRLETSRSN
jgi:two-component system sensor histidine kinase/response regulator